MDLHDATIVTIFAGITGMMHTILYLHGMGGGSDSRIPSILHVTLHIDGLAVVARTYDFDPELASAQIRGWVEELKPVMVIGESLGSLHALKITGIPHILISPALNAPYHFQVMAWLTLIPGVTWLFDRIYRPREGDRQPLHFTFHTLRKYRSHRREAMRISAASNDDFHAFIGTKDHYRRTGVVSLRTWKKHFGETYTIYDGTHFTEEEYIFSLIIPKIREFLKLS